MTDRVVLGLDQSQNVGFCVGEPGSPLPMAGVWTVPDYAGNEGRTFWAFENWLVNFIKSEGVTNVFWEGVFVMPGRVDMNTIFKMVSYANAIQAACEDDRVGFSVPNAYVPKLTWIKNFVGTAKGGSDFQKEQVTAECSRRGWIVQNHHAADACGIWVYGCMIVDPTLRPKQEARGNERRFATSHNRTKRTGASIT